MTFYEFALKVASDHPLLTFWKMFTIAQHGQ
jgi:hypothetical protein